MTNTDASLPYQAPLLHKAPLGPDIWLLRFARPRATTAGLADWAFSAGQYTQIGLAGHASRPYSIASGADQPHIDLHIRDTGHGLSHALCHCTPGQDAFFSPPAGQGLSIATINRPLVLAAGGVGLAPILSILDTVTDLPVPPRLYWGCETPDDLYLHQSLSGMAQDGRLAYIPLVAKGDGPWRQGHVGPALTGDIPDLAGYALYLSGPQAMIAATVPLLLRHNAEKAYIFGDGIGL